MVGGKFAEILIGSDRPRRWSGWGAASGPVIAGMPLGLWLLLGAIGLFAIQTTLLNPSLLGTIPETVPTPTALGGQRHLRAWSRWPPRSSGMAAGNWLADATWLSPAPDPDRPLPAWLAAMPWGHAAAGGRPAWLGVATVGWLVSLLLPRIAGGRSRRPGFPATPSRRPSPTSAGSCERRSSPARRRESSSSGRWRAVAQLNVDQYAFESGGDQPGGGRAAAGRAWSAGSAPAA